MANLFRSLFRNPEGPKGSSTNDSEEQVQKNVEKLLQNWSPPKIPIHSVYQKRGIFEFKSNPAIKTLEKTVFIREEYEDFKLFERSEILEHQREYHYLHIGLIQVAVKPLTQNGLNKSVLFCLHDGRCLEFDPSLMAIAESSLCDGPIYLNCYPDFAVSLSDKHILDVCTLSIKTHGFNTDQKSQDIVVVYRFYYKLLMSAFEGLKASNQETTFVQTNLLTTKVAVPKTIQRDSNIEVPERWRARRGRNEAEILREN